MQKIFGGARLRRLRDERGLTQLALARRLDLSASYVNQLENDQRPLTLPVLLKLNSAFDLDANYFAGDEDARLLADLAEVFADEPGAPHVGAGELEDLVVRAPTAAHTLVAMHRRVRAMAEQLDRFQEGEDGYEGEEREDAGAPYEDVRDFFYDRRNHILDLDLAAEAMFDAAGFEIGGLDRQLAEHLRSRYGVTVAMGEGPAKRHFDGPARVLTLARRLSPGQRAFQLATQLAFFTQEDLIEAQLVDTDLAPQSRALARIGLANYFAGALILPYGEFLSAAEQTRYDIEVLASRFEVGFETVAHRLSTLQRPGRRGVPLFFVRIDRAGNISKRQSATGFHFSRVGGSCPLWVVHEAFDSPGRIRTQISAMPDGRSYFWLARTTDESSPGYLAPRRDFAIGLGCDLAHAHRLVYSHGVALDDPDTAVPIGAGCKVCSRADCAQRAFPQLGRSLRIDENEASRVPYTPAG
ncbi:XRE family transcriptional regulator [Rhodococcus rhodnii]|uniref:XRE family transcriptional regulator n=1 Tax=Rhodococcus rhodnii TaxID=38312 RepID=A0A6P2CDS3_9NOCA|nr:short-chain fatty acyl-CoA regulator family protein [Rhodococcus rhodnii]TXG90502.1 XRE family transcriptional regulator [Rhodococcus rhodnii]